MGIFRSLLRTCGARPKQRKRIRYGGPSYWNITLFLWSWECGTYNYVSLRSRLHMCSLLCKRVFKYWKRFISDCRKGMCWFNSFKLIKGLLPLSFFFTRNILFGNWPLCEQTWRTSSRDSALLYNEIVAYSCIEKIIYLGFLFRLGL